MRSYAHVCGADCGFHIPSEYYDFAFRYSAASDRSFGLLATTVSWVDECGLYAASQLLKGRERCASLLSNPAGC